MNPLVTPATGRRIGSCERCGAALPLCRALISFEARTWYCNRCNQEHKGQLAADYTIDELRNLRPETLKFDRSQIPPASRDLLRSSERLSPSPGHEGRDKRRSVRYPVVATIPVQPVDAMVQSVDAPFIVVAKNISTGGICVLSDRAIETPFLILELPAPGNEPVQVLVQIVRNRPRGNLYEIGGEFITKLVAKPTAR